MRLSAALTMTFAVTFGLISTVLAIQGPPATGANLGSVTGGDFKKAHVVIQKKCVSCHNEKVIEEAMAAGKNMQEIQQRMERKGARLSADDRTVLGVFYRETPLKKGR